MPKSKMTPEEYLSYLEDKKRKNNELINEKIKATKELTRKRRTKRLIELGAVIEKVYGQPLEKDMLPIVEMVLLGKDGQGIGFRNSIDTAKEAAKKENINTQ